MSNETDDLLAKFEAGDVDPDKLIAFLDEALGPLPNYDSDKDDQALAE